MGKRTKYVSFSALTVLTEQALRSVDGFGPKTRINSRLERIGCGCSFQSFAFSVNLAADQIDEGAYVLRWIDPNHDEDTTVECELRLHQEAKTLKALEDFAFEFQFPRFHTLVHDETGRVRGLIESWLPGVALKNARAIGFSELPELIGRIAANIHRLPIDSFGHLTFELAAMRSIRESVDALLLKRHSIVARALDWIEEVLETSPEACVCHGDLLPQNILYVVNGWQETPFAKLGVLDWEYTKISRPADDFAIVTRGHRQPHKVENFHERMLKAYWEAGGLPVNRTQLAAEEAILVLGWLNSTWHENGKRNVGHSADHYVQMLESHLRKSLGRSRQS